MERMKGLLTLTVCVLLCLSTLGQDVESVDKKKKKEKTFSWIPTDECKWPKAFQVCYQGKDKTRLSQVGKFDVLNPCQKHSEVVDKACKDHGFAKYIGVDPIFKNLTLWGREKGHIFESLEVGNGLSFRGAGYPGVCWRGAKSRGFGHLATKEDPCTGDEEEQLGICYPKCGSEKQVGIGPLCWNDCPTSSHPVTEGPICCEKATDCDEMIRDITWKLAEDIGKIIIDHENKEKLLADLKKLMEDAQGLDIPVCSD